MRNALQWTTSLREAIEILRVSPSSEAMTVFWLRLYGVLCEIRAGHAPVEDEPSEVAAQAASTVSDPYTEEAEAATEYFAALAADVYSACERMLAAFNEDERMFLQWQRDNEAHVWLESYELGIRKKKLVDDRMHGLVGRKIPHEQVHVVVAAFLAARDLRAITIDFAERAYPFVDGIIEALRKFS